MDSRRIRDVYAVAIIGANQQPIYIRTFGEEKSVSCGEGEQDVWFHYYIHMSLDIVEEKLKLGAMPGTPSRVSSYLGLLCPIENFRVYGYVTCSKIKLVLVVSDQVHKDSDVKAVSPC